MYPLLLALLPGKIQAVYTQLLTKFKTSMADLQLFMNFETAAHSATRTVFPGITVKGCFFHYTQAIWRITQHTGLQVTYRNNDIRQLVRRAAVTTLIDGFNRRRLFQCYKWPRWYWYTSHHNYIHELCYNPMNRRWPTNMEPLQHRCTAYHKSHRGLAQQTEVESLPCTPKLLHIDQHIQRHPGSKWSNQNTA
jgi:hypothetical protein